MNRWKSMKPVQGRWMTSLAAELGYKPEDVLSMRVNRNEFIVVHRDETGRMQITEHTIERPAGEW